MKTHKSTNTRIYPNLTNLALMFLLLAALAVPALKADAQVTNTWTGTSTVTNLWSDSNNWSLLQLPGAGDSVVFTNAIGSTNVQGAVNNVMDTNWTINSLCYAALSNNFQTTLIKPGQTLTVNSPGTTSINLLLASTLTTGLNDQLYATILGAGGSLVVGNPNSPSTSANVWLNVQQTSATAGAHLATLDLSGLDSFTFAGGQVRIGGNGSSSSLDRPAGMLILAKTNLIIATSSASASTTPDTSAAIILAMGTGSSSVGIIELGQQNTIYANYIEIGTVKANVFAGPGQGGQMLFQNGLSNPTLTLRGKDGVSRVTFLNIGDQYQSGSGTGGSVGSMNLTGGAVDALVGTLWVGRNNAAVNSSYKGSGVGTLTLTAGTFDVTTMYIGCQVANNAGYSQGTVNVGGTASLIVRSPLNIGHAGSYGGTGTGTGLLNINGGQVSVSGDVTKHNDAAFAYTGANQNSHSTINITNNGLLNMQPSGAAAPGNITVDTLNFSRGSVTNYGTLSLSNLNVIAPATAFTVYPGQGLGPVGPGAIGTLTTSGNLTLTNATLCYDLVDPSSVNDQIAVTGTLTLSGTNLLAINPTNPPFGLGAYTLMTYGTLSGNAANLQMTGAWASSRYTFAFDTSVSPNVVLNVGGSPPASLTWSGDGSANLWDLKTSTNWNSNTEMFYSMDTVTFDDTSTNPVVNLVGALMPGGVTVNTFYSYTFSGSGKISGVAGLVNNYSGTLTILTTNDYTGATTINAGTLLVNGALGNTVVTVNSGATLGGTGVILGPVTAASGGIFSPGAPSGTLAISNNLVLAAGSTSVFAADLDTLASASVVGLSKVTYGGTLSLALSGRAPVASDTFKLFSAATYAGTFASISPAAPGDNLAWNTNTLAADGTLRIVSLAPPNIGVRVTGNQLSLSWPSVNTGWYLQAQTNSISVGLSNNWVNVPGSITTNFVIMTINPTNGCVFYRLISP
jgi:fibronectin-binding autotransporter adhesin